MAVDAQSLEYSAFETAHQEIGQKKSARFGAQQALEAPRLPFPLGKPLITVQTGQPRHMKTCQHLVKRAIGATVAVDHRYAIMGGNELTQEPFDLRRNALGKQVIAGRHGMQAHRPAMAFDQRNDLAGQCTAENQGDLHARRSRRARRASSADLRSATVTSPTKDSTASAGW